MQRIVPWTTAALLAAALATPAHAQMMQEDAQPFLMVTGQGEASVPSDRARIDFMVETQAPTAAAAASQNAERMDRVIRAVREAGGQSVQVETGGYNLNPVYRHSREGDQIPVIEAYRAVNHVQVRADDVARVGALLDAGIGAGANRISSLSFEAKDREPARVQALAEAVRTARLEAEAVAGALGMRLGTALEVHTGTDYGYPPPMPYMARDMEMAAQVAPTPVEPGETTVRANVTIKYALVGG